MLLSMRRHRRRPMNSFVVEERSRWPLRLVIGVILLLLLWFIGSKVFAFLTGSASERTSARLTVTSGANVEVALQGEDPKRAENDLKIYEGDTVHTRSNGEATITFFDGTRIRMDQDTELTIVTSSKVEDDTSTLEIDVPSGRVWIVSPDEDAFDGQIDRTVTLENFTASVSADTHALLAEDLIIVEQAPGLGLPVTLTLADTKESSITLGEGQLLVLDEDARASIASGSDPYDFRDPLTRDKISDPFILASISSTGLAIDDDITTSTGSTTDDSTEHLTVTSPENNITIASDTVLVAGRVGSRVRTVNVNGYDVPVKVDRTFSQEVAVPAGGSLTLSIEARNAEGLTLTEVTRTVQRSRPVLGLPTITRPGGSGQTVTVTEPEVELQGTAPANTTGIMVNDYKLQLFKPGSRTWSYLASTALGNMKVGDNVFAVRTIDEAGNMSAPVSIKVIYNDGTVPTSSAGTSSSSQISIPMLNNAPLKPGTVKVTAPTSGTPLETSEVEILIEGATPADTFAVFVNDYRLMLYQPGKTFWNYKASDALGTMKAGKNTYTVTARNQKGEIIDTVTYEITYTK